MDDIVEVSWFLVRIRVWRGAWRSYGDLGVAVARRLPVQHYPDGVDVRYDSRLMTVFHAVLYNHHINARFSRF